MIPIIMLSISAVFRREVRDATLFHGSHGPLRSHLGSFIFIVNLLRDVNRDRLLFLVMVVHVGVLLYVHVILIVRLMLILKFFAVSAVHLFLYVILVFSHVARIGHFKFDYRIRLSVDLYTL